MPYQTTIISLLGEFKNWLLAIGGVLAVLVNVGRAIKYQAATEQEKAEIVVGIRNSMVMIFGAFFLAWLALYIYTKFAGVAIP